MVTDGCKLPGKHSQDFATSICADVLCHVEAIFGAQWDV